MSNKTTRRQFLTRAMIAGGAVTAAGIPIRLLAQDKVAEDDPLAVSMGYKHDASEVDTTTYPKRAGEAGAKQYCYNCALYQGDADAEWAPCAIFANKLVANKGWCNAWVAKA